MYRFIQLVLLACFSLSLCAFSDESTSRIGQYLSPKSSGDVISATEWNSLYAGLVSGASRVNIANTHADIIISASDATFNGQAKPWQSGLVVPLWRPPKDSCEITSIEAGTIGGGTLAFGLEERDVSAMDVAGTANLDLIKNATIDASMETIPSASLRDDTIASNRILCATFSTDCVTSTVNFLYMRIYYNYTSQ